MGANYVTAIIALDGVLRTETGDPIPEGMKLFRTLVENYRMVISADSDLDDADHFLKTNFVFGISKIYSSADSYVGTELRIRHLELARASGPVEMLIDSDAGVCAAALKLGIPVILFATPKYLRTTKPVRPWQDLTNEVERQRKQLAEEYLKNMGSRFE